MHAIVEGEHWMCERFATDHLRLVTSPQNPLCTLQTITPDLLHDQTLFLREQGSSTRRGAEALLHGLEEWFGRVVEITSAEAIKESVIVGLGVAVLSSLAAKREEQGGFLRPVQDVRFHKERRFYVAHRSDRPPVGAAAALWQFLVSATQAL